MEKVPDFKAFAKCIAETVPTVRERTLAFLYYRSRFIDGRAEVRDIVADFQAAGLGNPKATRIREALKNDPRTKKVGVNAWILSSDKFEDVENELELNRCLAQTPVTTATKKATTKKAPRGLGYVDARRIKELKAVSSTKFDLSRLVQMCVEINDNYSRDNSISTIMLVRAVLDHVPPIFGFVSFAEVANNLKTTKSTKDTFQHLENSSRKIADRYLHTYIRSKEDMPTKTQVNFSQDFDVLLSEIFLILK